MGVFVDIDALLRPFANEAPCGENLEYDPDFQALLRAAEGRPERAMGDKVIEAEPPDWAAVALRSTALFQRTKDLRVAMHLVRSLLVTQGLPGFRDGLEVIARLLGEYWDSVHPQLDPDDGNDPTARISALSGLCGSEAVLKDLRSAPLACSQALGFVSYRDVALAFGEMKPVGGAVARDIAEIKGVFLDCPADELLETAAAAAACLDNLRAVERLLTERVSSSRSLDFTAALSMMQGIVKFLHARVDERGLTAQPELPSAQQPAASPADGSGAAHAPLPLSGEVSNRDDVIRLLDRICAYYAKSEPSSPVPLLLFRAKHLISKDFIDVLRDIAPEAVAQAEAIRGRGEF